MKKLKMCFVVLLSALFVPCISAQNTPSTPPTAETLPAGISLPKSGTIFALENQEGHPELEQLHPSEIVSNSHAAGNFARSMVYVGARASFELDGASAAIKVNGQHTSFLVKIDAEDPELMRERVRLIRLEPMKDRRVVVGFSQNIFGGQRKKTYDEVAVIKTDEEANVWLKVTPQAPLPPGEYGIVFMPKDSNLAPGVVYDFEITGTASKTSQK